MKSFFSLLIIIVCFLAIGCRRKSDHIPTSFLYKPNFEYLRTQVDNTLSLDTIIERHIRALGGRDAINSIRFIDERLQVIDGTDTTFLEGSFVPGISGIQHLRNADSSRTSYCLPSGAYSIIDVFGEPIKYRNTEYRDTVFPESINGRNYYCYPWVLTDFRAYGSKVSYDTAMNTSHYIVVVKISDQRELILSINPVTFLVDVTLTKLKLNLKSDPVILLAKHFDFVKSEHGYFYAKQFRAFTGHRDSPDQDFKAKADFSVDGVMEVKKNQSDSLVQDYLKQCGCESLFKPGPAI